RRRWGVGRIRQPRSRAAAAGEGHELAGLERVSISPALLRRAGVQAQLTIRRGPSRGNDGAAGRRNLRLATWAKEYRVGDAVLLPLKRLADDFRPRNPLG